MLLAHLADTHLGYRQYGLSWREEDIYGLFREAFEGALKEGVNAVLISGDMFDKYRPPNRAVKVAIEMVEMASSKGVPTYAILGEHDLPKRYDLPPQTLIPGVKLLGTSTTPSRDVLRVDGAEYVIAGISHHPPRRRYLEGLRRAIEGLRPVLRGRKSVLMLHQNVKQFFRLEEGIDINDIPEEVTYAALGHLHRRVVKVVGEGRVVAYPGSIDILRMDEVGEWARNGKGYYIVDLSGDEPVVHRVNLDVRPQAVVRTEYPRHLSDVARAVKVLPREPKGILHVVVKAPADVKVDIGAEVSRAVGPSAYVRVRVERYVRSPEEVRMAESLDEAYVVASVLGNPKDPRVVEVARAIVKVKNILAGVEEGDLEAWVEKVLSARDLWVERVGSLPTASPPLPGKGLLRFAGG